MLNQRLAAAKAVAAELFPTEKLIEDAILKNARLTIAVIEGRQSARLPITTGQDSLAAIINVAAALVQARQQIAVAHTALAKDKIDIGLGARGMGDWGECPKAENSEPEVSGLRVVA